MKKKQFTLIEMLVVIAIIAVLATMIGAAVIAVRENGNRTACLNNLSQIQKAIYQYEMNNGGVPFVSGVNTANGAKHEDLLYLIRRTEAGDEPNLYKCPSASNTILGSTKVRGELPVQRADSDFSAKNNSYAYHMGKIDGNSVGVTLNPASGIISDGWVSVGSSVEETDDAGWNHQGAGNWVTKGGTGKKVEQDEGPDQVGIYGDNWNAFKLW